MAGYIGTVFFTGDVTASGGTFLPTGDTAAGDDAAVGYASADGLVLTGQGSTSDVTIKNDADATVMSIATGTTGATFAGDVIVPDGDLILGSTAVTSTAAELNILDGVTATAAEINLIDGGTARGTTAIADGDGVLINDAGTMRMTTVQTVKTYMTAGAGGGGMEFISSTGAMSGAASAIFTGFDSSKYDHYRFWFQNVIPATDAVSLYGYHSTDGGASYDSTDGDYHYAATTDSTGFIVAGRHGSYTVGSDTNEFGCSGYFDLYSPHLAAYTYSATFMFYTTISGQYYSTHQIDGPGSVRLAAEDTDAIKFQFTSGNIESGEITMFGIVNS